MPKSSRATALALLLTTWPLMAPRAGDDPPRTGPESEKRFPPLKVPPGFKATLFACDPLVEYPSAIAAGPRAGAIFVAIDYMTRPRGRDRPPRRDPAGRGHRRRRLRRQGDGLRGRLQLDPGARLPRRDPVRHARPVPHGRARPRRRRRGRRPARPADRPGAAAREEPARGCTAPTAWSPATTAGSTWPWATTAATSRGPRATGWCSTAAASCAAGPTAATCTSSPPACATSTTSPSTRS